MIMTMKINFCCISKIEDLMSENANTINAMGTRFIDIRGMTSDANVPFSLQRNNFFFNQHEELKRGTMKRVQIC